MGGVPGYRPLSAGGSVGASRGPVRRAQSVEPAYFLRRSVARSCSSASRSQIRAISNREARPSLPVGKLFAILRQSCARSRYWFDRFVIVGARSSAK
jgi:hypothetical protein